MQDCWRRCRQGSSFISNGHEHAKSCYHCHCRERSQMPAILCLASQQASFSTAPSMHWVFRSCSKVPPAVAASPKPHLLLQQHVRAALTCTCNQNSLQGSHQPELLTVGCWGAQSTPLSAQEGTCSSVCISFWALRCATYMTVLGCGSRCLCDMKGITSLHSAHALAPVCDQHGPQLTMQQHWSRACRAQLAHQLCHGAPARAWCLLLWSPLYRGCSALTQPEACCF